MTLKERINEDMKTAMRARDAARLGAVRLLLAAIKQKEVDERVALDDAGVQAVIDKMLKQRRDSIAQYTTAGRDDLVAAEKFEADVLSAYMPAAMSDAEVDAAVAVAIASTGAAAPGDMGKVMAVLKAELAGRADMSEVSKRVRARLASA